MWITVRRAVTHVGAPFLALSSVAGLAGCSTEEGGTGIDVVTSIYPLQWVAERVGGDHVDVTNLTQAGREPHDLELTIKQTAAVGAADLVLYAGGFQAAVDEAVDSQGPTESIDAIQVISDQPDLEVLDGDPHFWLDPRALRAVADQTAAELIRADPDNAEEYRENLAELDADLIGLDGRLSVMLDDCQRRIVVTTHEAFGWFGARYDLDFQAVTGLSPDAEPSISHLVELSDLIKTDGITTVFTEALASPEVAETLAEDLGITTAVLDPVEGLSDETSNQDYLSLMDSNGEALVKANGCTGKAR